MITLFKNKYSLSEITNKSMRLVQHNFQLAHLKSSLTKDKSLLFFDSPDFTHLHEKILALPALPIKTNIISLRNISSYENSVATILSEADKYCKNEFNILGSGWLKWENNSDIAWHSDKINEYSWDKNLFYTDVKKIIKRQIESGAAVNADCKIPRELSRFYFLFSLMFAHFFSEDEKYLSKIESSILDWTNDNAPYYGVNWSNAMEAAIRLFNWCFSVYSLKEAFSGNHSFLKTFYQSLYRHFLFITKNLETLGNRNNHYVANISGIFTMCFLFPVFQQNKKWLKWSVEQLETEITRQTFADGVGFECSTTYHRLALEMFFIPLYLSDMLSMELFSPQYRQKIFEMFDFSLNILKPNGEVCQFGDNDNGRFFQLENRKSLDHSYLPGLAFGLFNDNRFCQKDTNFSVESYTLFGEKAFKNAQIQVEEAKERKLPSKGFADSGIYVLRNDNFTLSVSCQANSKEVRGVHVHNDKLSFDLSFLDQNIIVDPGTVTYLGDTIIRNKYRSTCYHNTVQENDLEQNNFGNNIFKMNDEARVRVNNFCDSFLDCQHDGFQLKNGSLHRRKITLGKKEVLIHDEIISASLCRSFLHFDPDLQIDLTGNEVKISRSDTKLLTVLFDNTQNIDLVDYDYSPGYGERVKAKKLIVTFTNFLNTKIFIQKAN